MRIDDLKRPADEIAERIEMEAYTGNPGDYFTAILWPYRKRRNIEALKSPVPIETLIQYATENGTDITDEAAINRAVQELLKSRPEILTGWDQGYNYKCQALINGIDPNEHSLTDQDGRPVVLDLKFFEDLANINPAIFDYLVTRVEALNGLGE